MNPFQSVRAYLDQRKLRRELRAISGGGGYVPAAPVLSGTFVTPETALGLTAVYAAVNVISRDMAGLPRAVNKIMPDGGRVKDPKDRRQPLLCYAPNDEMGQFRFVQTLMSHVLTRGNGYAEIVRGPDGFPTSFEILHPVKTLPKRTDSGQLYYELENHAKVPPENVLHFAGMGFDGIVGYSPITIARQSLGLAIAADQFGAAFFGNGAVPKGILQHPRRLSEAATSNLRKTFNQVHQGSQSAHNIAILEEGMTWNDTQVAPEDAQFLQTRQFQVIEVARLYGIPPHKLGDYSQSHLRNIEESNLDYLSMTLVSWIGMWDDEMNRKLIMPWERDTQVIATDLSAMSRGDTAARTPYYQTMRNMGAMSANDIRVAEGMLSLPEGSGGDTYVVQGQYVPLDQVGDAPAVPPPATPPPPGSAAPPPAEKPPETDLERAKRSIEDITAVLRGELLDFLCLGRRFNENHDAQGKFSSGDGSGSSDITAGVDDASVRDHPDAVAARADAAETIQATKDQHASDTAEQQKSNAQDAKDLAKDQAGDKKDLAKGQAQEIKQLAKDQAKEVKQLAAAQEKERAEIEKDPEATAEDKAELAEAHAKEQADLASDQQAERDDQASTHAEEAKDLADSHTQAAADLASEHEANLAELAAGQKEELADIAAELKSNYADLVADLKEPVD